jgi:hypothetical protein
MGEEIKFYNFKPQSINQYIIQKQQILKTIDSMAAYGIPTKEEPYICKIFATFFWHHQDAVLVNSVSGRTTVNSDRYVRALPIPYTRLLRAISGRNVSNMMILRDTTKPYQFRHFWDRQKISMESVTLPIL